MWHCSLFSPPSLFSPFRALPLPATILQHETTLTLPQVRSEDLDQTDLERRDLAVHENTSQIELDLEPDVDVSPIDSARRQRVSKPRERKVAHVGLHQRVNRRFYSWSAETFGTTENPRFLP